MTNKVDLYVNGEFSQGSGTETIAVTNPANQEVLAEVACATL
jgi:acyl-CoA reductase-like NAD-dependent aldehyde dehydrogenase